MILRTCASLFLCAVLSGSTWADPASSPSSASEKIEPSEISQAIRSDAISIPTPGELFAALAKPGKPDWASRYRGPISINYKTRTQIALNLGGLIADGFIAVEAQD